MIKKAASMLLEELETPCLVLDRVKLERNIKRLEVHLDSLGVQLRPHVKTAKSIDVINLVFHGQKDPITVSTLKEAEFFFRAGYTDLLYAVGIAPIKLGRVADLMTQGADIKIVLDTIEQAKAVAEKGQELDIAFAVLIEIDSDGHRAGVSPQSSLLIDIAKICHQHTGISLRGVMTHAGESYNCKNIDAIRAMSVQERDAIVMSANRIKAAGLPCPIVSMGSTPTAFFAEDLTGVTEVRAGVYVFFDLVMAGLDVCKIEDIALSVLCSVIGRQTEKGWILTDAGWMALSRDRGTAKQKIDQGYGVVCDRLGNVLSDFIVADVNQEHGVVSLRKKGIPDYEKFPVGTQLRILPNHACATGGMHDRYYVVQGDNQVRQVWSRLNGW